MYGGEEKMQRVATVSWCGLKSGDQKRMGGLGISHLNQDLGFGIESHMVMASEIST
jgi:hypothetical protein